jgi:membrane dipeptidase
VTNGALVWDNHVCLPLRPDDLSFLPELARHRAAGTTMVSLNAGFGSVAFDDVVRMLKAFRAWYGARPEEYLLVESPQDVQRARSSGRLGIVFDVEGGDCLGTEPERLLELRALGVRWMLIAYNRNNALGGGCQDEDRGLTPLGIEVHELMERIGIVACCSHTGLRTTLDILARATRPVIFSHSNPAGCWPHRRNISDEAIRRCAATGGVVGINGIGIFLGRNEASIDAVVRHIEYVLELVGPDHVAIGLDYIYDRVELNEYVVAHPDLYPPSEGYGTGIAMLEPERLPDLVDRLLVRGHPQTTVAAILGENWLRVATQCW